MFVLILFVVLTVVINLREKGFGAVDWINLGEILGSHGDEYEDSYLHPGLMKLIIGTGGGLW
jgi:hypothetical protein